MQQFRAAADPEGQAGIQRRGFLYINGRPAGRAAAARPTRSRAHASVQALFAAFATWEATALRLILFTLCVVALATTSAATHRAGCEPTTSSPEIDVAGHYVDNDLGSDPISIWVYAESNGITGLQRADEVVDDTCGHPENGDTIIF